MKKGRFSENQIIGFIKQATLPVRAEDPYRFKASYLNQP